MYLKCQCQLSEGSPPRLQTGACNQCVYGYSLWHAKLIYVVYLLWWSVGGMGMGMALV